MNLSVDKEVKKLKNDFKILIFTDKISLRPCRFVKFKT